MNERVCWETYKKEHLVRFILMLLVLIFLLLMQIESGKSYIPYIVNGNSMYPTLKDGDLIIINTKKIPQQNEIVVFSSGIDQHEYWIKRVIAREGMSVLIDYDNNIIFIDEQCLIENYINYEQSDPMKPITGKKCEYYYVDSESYFLLGDNRNYSIDSRRKEIGFVNKDRIVGTVVFKMRLFMKGGL